MVAVAVAAAAAAVVVAAVMASAVVVVGDRFRALVRVWVGRLDNMNPVRFQVLALTVQLGSYSFLIGWLLGVPGPISVQEFLGFVTSSPS